MSTIHKSTTTKIPDYFLKKYYGSFGDDTFKADVKPGDIAFVRLLTYNVDKNGVAVPCKNPEYDDYIERKLQVKFIEKLYDDRGYENYIIYLLKQQVYLRVYVNGDERTFKIHCAMHMPYVRKHGNLPVNKKVLDYYTSNF